MPAVMCVRGPLFDSCASALVSLKVCGPLLWLLLGGQRAPGAQWHASGGLVQAPCGAPRPLSELAIHANKFPTDKKRAPWHP